MTTKTLSADEFGLGFLKAIQRHMHEQTDMPVAFDKPNVFYYTPKIQSMVIDENFFEEVDLEKMTKASAYLKAHPKQKIPKEILDVESLRTQIVFNEPKSWKMNIDAKLFDSNARKLIDYSINDFKFGSPVPNKSMIFPYIKDGNKRFYGILLPLPRLKANMQYQLEVVEKYEFHPENLMPAHFTRKVIVPLEVNNDNSSASFDFYNKGVVRHKDYPDTDSCMFSFSELNHKVDPFKCGIQNVFGAQSFYSGIRFLPSLLLMINLLAICNEYCDAKLDLTDTAYDFGDNVDYDKISKLLDNFLDFGTKSFFASLVNAKITTGQQLKERNHNGLGSINVNLFPQIYATKISDDHKIENRYHATESCYQIRSRYDFEELCPKVILHNEKKRNDDDI